MIAVDAVAVSGSVTSVGPSLSSLQSACEASSSGHVVAALCVNSILRITTCAFVMTSVFCPMVIVMS